MLALVLVAVARCSSAVLLKHRPIQSCRRTRLTAQPSKRRRMAIGMWDLELLSTLGHSRQSALETISSFRMIRMRVSAELTYITS